MSPLLKSIGVLSIIILFVLIFGCYIKSYEGMDNAKPVAIPLNSTSVPVTIPAPAQVPVPAPAQVPVPVTVPVPVVNPTNQLAVSSPDLTQQNIVDSYGNSGTPVSNIKSYDF